MARYNTSRYQYETSPRKLQPEYAPARKKYPKKSTAKQRNQKQSNKKISEQQAVKKVNSSIILGIAVVFVVLFAVSYRNALIAEKYSDIKELKTQLSSIQKDNKQIEVNIESKTNLGTIEEKAQSELGLKKLGDSQTVYMSLDKHDYIESSEEGVKIQEDSWFQKIINKIKNIF